MEERENEVVSTYTDNDKLKDRMGADAVGYDIFVTSLGTILKYDTSGRKKEITFDGFVKEAETRISKGEISIRYDKESNRFVLVDNVGKTRYAHIIDINDESMKDYAFGNLDYYTSKLNDLTAKSEEKTSIDNALQSREATTNEVIAKIENTHEIPTPIEARMYLDYLNGLNKTNAKIIGKQVSKIAAVGGTHIAAAALVTGAVVAGAPVTVPTVLVGAAVAGLTTFATDLLEDLILMFTGENKDDFVLTQTITSLKSWINDVKDRMGELKVNRQKSKQLLQIPYVDRLVVPDSVSVEEHDIAPLNLKDNILSEMNSLVDRISLVDPEIRDDLLSEVRTMLGEYIDRKNSITNKSVGEDSLVQLRIDTCKKLAHLEVRVQKIRDQEKKTKALSAEGKMLEDKIDNIETKEPVLAGESKGI